MNGTSSSDPSPTLLGHPPGLFTLFFAEMWERFSYYGMRALLVFYMIKGFLGYNDEQAYSVYGAYTGLVYATPFIGGMLADRLLGQRFAVVVGGLLMSAGHLAMTFENEIIFFIALALLIVGNGFFKPNISTIVGSLYPKASQRKDAGFTLFYMGINLGAAISPIACGYVGETYGWHYGFGLATMGMLIGVAIFIAPTRLTQALILGGAVVTALSMIFQTQLEQTAVQMMGVNTPLADISSLQVGARIFLGLALLISGVIATIALTKGGIPKEVGGPPSIERLKQRAAPILSKHLPTYYGVVAILAILYGWFHRDSSWELWALGIMAASAIALPWVTAKQAIFVGIAGIVPLLTVIMQQGGLAGIVLYSLVIIAFGSIFICAVNSKKVERERLFVVLILTFFSVLFWAFFEQAGSSINNFTDRNVDRTSESRTIGQEDIGTTLTFRVPIKTDDSELATLPLLSQEQLGYANGDEDFTMTTLTELREAMTAEDPAEAPVDRVTWNLTDQHLGMGIVEAGKGSEIPASEFQAANPIFILLFGLVFSTLWTFLGQRGKEPTTPMKFAFSFLQLGLGFAALWYGAFIADDRGMVALHWLLLGYLLHTTGELCLSPVGLSMVTKLSPTKIVSTVMGAWFIATALANFVGGQIAGLTNVSHGDSTSIPIPKETVSIYGNVYGWIGLVTLGTAVLCLALTPLLKKWMHIGVEDETVA